MVECKNGYSVDTIDARNATRLIPKAEYNPGVVLVFAGDGKNKKREKKDKKKIADSVFSSDISTDVEKYFPAAAVVISEKEGGGEKNANDFLLPKVDTSTQTDNPQTVANNKPAIRPQRAKLARNGFENCEIF